MATGLPDGWCSFDDRVPISSFTSLSDFMQSNSINTVEEMMLSQIIRAELGSVAAVSWTLSVCVTRPML